MGDKLKRPARLVLFDLPDLRIEIDTMGGGTTCLNYELIINGEWVTFDSSDAAWCTREMFPNQARLLDWIAEVEAWSKAKYDKKNPPRNPTPGSYTYAPFTPGVGHE